ncbi:MAG: hypothetical protein H8D47_02595 [Planctomycetes bacterium]|nr:hypothetical protein [Planctomycetota bacterium]MBL7106806.1 hypothetical protein [Phycisphaerae bacterium]
MEEKRLKEFRRLAVAVLVIFLLAFLVKTGMKRFDDEKYDYYTAIAENIEPWQLIEYSQGGPDNLAADFDNSSKENVRLGVSIIEDIKISGVPESTEEVRLAQLTGSGSSGSSSSGSSGFLQGGGGSALSFVGGGLFAGGGGGSDDVFVSGGYYSGTNDSDDGDYDNGASGDGGIVVEPDAVVYHTPAPAAVMLGSLGVLLVGFLRRGINKSRQDL